MILLLFFFPLAVYFLVLGCLNQRRSPLLVPGVWDGIGLIFGVSGFLLFAGPAVLSAVSERWRLFWLLGRGNLPLTGADGPWQFWIFLSVLYFLLIVGGTAYYLRRQRSLTAIYNADAAQVERALLAVCKQLGLDPGCSGQLFLFSPQSAVRSPQQNSSLQPGAFTGLMASAVQAEPPLARSGENGLEQTTLLEVDSFSLLRHVTLRWEPAEAPLRPTLESALNRQLSETHTEEGHQGGWLLTIGFVLLSLDIAGAFFVVVLHLISQ